MNTMRIALSCGLMIAALGLSGCVVALGNRDSGKISHTTRGQELIDLKRARETGAISEEEYQTQKRRLMDEPIKK